MPALPCACCHASMPEMFPSASWKTELEQAGRDCPWGPQSRKACLFSNFLHFLLVTFQWSLPSQWPALFPHPAPSILPAEEREGPSSKKQAGCRKTVEGRRRIKLSPLLPRRKTSPPGTTSYSLFATCNNIYLPGNTHMGLCWIYVGRDAVCLRKDLLPLLIATSKNHPQKEAFGT